MGNCWAFKVLWVDGSDNTKFMMNSEGHKLPLAHILWACVQSLAGLLAARHFLKRFAEKGRLVLKKGVTAVIPISSLQQALWCIAICLRGFRHDWSFMGMRNSSKTIGTRYFSCFRISSMLTALWLLKQHTWIWHMLFLKPKETLLFLCHLVDSKLCHFWIHRNFNTMAGLDFSLKLSPKFQDKVSIQDVWSTYCLLLSKFHQCDAINIVDQYTMRSETEVFANWIMTRVKELISLDIKPLSHTLSLYIFSPLDQ